MQYFCMVLFCFVLEEQPSEVLRFQKLKRGRKSKLRKHGDNYSGR